MEDTEPINVTSTAPALDVAAAGARAVLQLAGRTVLTRLVALIGTIALARLLSPSQFGAFAIVTLFVTLFSLVGDLGMGPALIQQERSPSKLELSTVLGAQLVMWSVIVVAVWLVAGVLPAVSPDLPPEASGVARLLSISLFFGGLRAVPTIMLTRILQFGPLAAIEILQQVVYFGIAVVLAAESFGIWSFAIAGVAQSVAATAALYGVWRHWPGLRFDIGIARRLWAFGISFQAGNVLTWARDSVVPIFGGLAGGLAAVGLLGFAWRNGQLVSAVEQIISRVAFPAFSRLQTEPSRLRTTVISSLELSLVVVCMVQGWIIATAPILVPVVFSDAWASAVVPVQLVCLGSLAGAPTFVLRSYVYACGESRRALVLTAVPMAVLFLGFPPLLLRFGLAGGAWSFILSAAVGLLLFIRATGPHIAFPWRASAGILLMTLIAAVVADVIVIFVGGLVGLLASGLAYLAVAAVGLRVVQPDLVRRTRVALSRGGLARVEPVSVTRTPIDM